MCTRSILTFSFSSSSDRFDGGRVQLAVSGRQECVGQPNVVLRHDRLDPKQFGDFPAARDDAWALILGRAACANSDHRHGAAERAQADYDLWQEAVVFHKEYSPAGC